jgi:hypothetical protein
MVMVLGRNENVLGASNSWAGLAMVRTSNVPVRSANEFCPFLFACGKAVEKYRLAWKKSKLFVIGKNNDTYLI